MLKICLAVATIFVFAPSLADAAPQKQRPAKVQKGNYQACFDRCFSVISSRGGAKSGTGVQRHCSARCTGTGR